LHYNILELSISNKININTCNVINKSEFIDKGWSIFHCVITATAFFYIEHQRRMT